MLMYLHIVHEYLIAQIKTMLKIYHVTSPTQIPVLLFAHDYVSHKI